MLIVYTITLLGILALGFFTLLIMDIKRVDSGTQFLATIFILLFFVSIIAKILN